MAKWLAASAAGMALAGQANAFTAPAAGPIAERAASTLRGSAAAPTSPSAAPSGSISYGCAAAVGAVGIAAAAATRTAKRVNVRSAKRAVVPVTACAAVKPGDTLPGISLDEGFPPEKFSVADYCKGKKVVLMGLPGAFTPTWSSTQVPGYLAKEAELKAKGVDAVLVYCVNDGAVMKGWASDQAIEGSMIKFLGDPSREFTEALGLVLDDPGPMSVLGYKRCKRFSMFIDNGVVKTLDVASYPDDPAGDDKPEVTLVENMLKQI